MVPCHVTLSIGSSQHGSLLLQSHQRRECVRANLLANVTMGAATLHLWPSLFFKVKSLVSSPLKERRLCRPANRRNQGSWRVGDVILESGTPPIVHELIYLCVYFVFYNSYCIVGGWEVNWHLSSGLSSNISTLCDLKQFSQPLCLNFLISKIRMVRVSTSQNPLRIT